MWQIRGKQNSCQIVAQCDLYGQEREAMMVTGNGKSDVAKFDVRFV